ncbi:hypothetical protein ACJ41O_003167 [Fusarium nematophilum]
MAPLPHQAGQARARDGIQQSLDFLNKSARICQRFEDRCRYQASNGSPSCGPIIELIKALGEDVRTLEDTLLGLSQSTATTLLDTLPDDFGDLLFSIQPRILTVLNLVDYDSRNDSTGGSGALNALFADKFILGDVGGPVSPRLVSDQDSTLRIMTELLSVLQDMGMGRPGQISTEEALRAFEKQRHNIERCFSEIAGRLEPRYVHKYKNMEELPYTVTSLGAGKGSFGIVRKMIRKRTGEALALKTFFEHSEREKVLHEIGILEVCDHPGIVKLVEAFTIEGDDNTIHGDTIDDDTVNDDTIHIVMSPWAPYTLERFLGASDTKRRDQCSWFEPGSAQSDRHVYRIMWQLADAVGYLHNKSIKHKDIKPDNILLHRPSSEDRRALLTDVGVSKVVYPGGSTKFYDASYIYLAPEQVAKKESSLPADIWQLGCCFALLVAVGKGGSSAYRKMWNSFSRDGEDCSFQIALEHKYFMRSFREVCFCGGAEKPTDSIAWNLVSKMLDPNPGTRFTIDTVLKYLKALE